MIEKNTRVYVKKNLQRKKDLIGSKRVKYFLNPVVVVASKR